MFRLPEKAISITSGEGEIISKGAVLCRAVGRKKEKKSQTIKERKEEGRTVIRRNYDDVTMVMNAKRDWNTKEANLFFI